SLERFTAPAGLPTGIVKISLSVRVFAQPAAIWLPSGDQAGAWMTAWVFVRLTAAPPVAGKTNRSPLYVAAMRALSGDQAGYESPIPVPATYATFDPSGAIVYTPIGCPGRLDVN